MMTMNFYDTSSLLLKADTLFEDNEDFAVSTITFQELENIKTSANKSEDLKFQARNLLRVLNEHQDEYTVVIFSEQFLKPIRKYDLEITNDTKILSCAIHMQKKLKIDDFCFITNDLALKRIANIFFEDVYSIQEDDEDYYNGFKEIIMTENEMAEFYSLPTDNVLNLLINQYLIIKNEDGEIVDKLVWTGEGYRPLKYEKFKSKWFEVKPMKGDVYQQLVADSFLNNKITLVKGPAGAGKSLLSLGFLLQQLDRNAIDKIIVFCNTVATRDSARLGFYPGTRDEKLLDSQIGNFLSSKLGSQIEVERMIQNEQLILLPMSDIRGYDTSDMRAGIYIPEAQNLTVDLMKLALQRIGEDGICIIDGDDKAQVDCVQYEGDNNGMRRVSKIFKGEPIYGEVELQQIHRSQIGRIADKM